MKKILIILDRTDNLGGVENYVISQINEFFKRNYEIALYTNAITHFTKNLMPKDIKFFTPWTEDCLDDIKDFVPDLVHSHPFYSITRGVEIANKFNIPFYVTMHGLYDFGFDNSPLGEKVKNRVSKVIAVDNAVYNILKGSVNCPNEKLIMLPNGVNIDKFKFSKPDKQLFNKLKLNNKYKTLVVVTRYDDSKEIPPLQLIECLPKISEKLNGLNVIFVGSGRQIHKIQDAINNVEIVKTSADNVEVNIKNKKLNIVTTGTVEDVEKYINLGDFVCASARTAIEAICCGKNVFQMGIGKWGCLIDNDNYNDTLFDIVKYTNYTNEELTNHIYWCLSQTDSINYATNGLCEKIRELCDLNKITDKMESIYSGC